MGRTLGIDPGSRVTGFGIVEGEWQSPRCVSFGTIRLVESQSLAERLVRLHSEISRILRDHDIQEVGIERVFVSKNADSALKLGHARGVLLLAVRQAGLPVFEYPPAQIKKVVTGGGRAEKGQVQSIVKLLLKLDREPPEDAADALAIAMCHQMMAGERELLASVDPALADVLQSRGRGRGRGGRGGGVRLEDFEVDADGYAVPAGRRR